MAGFRAPGVLNIAAIEDRVWERQLKREHSELLDRINNLAEKRDRDIEALQGKFEATADTSNNAVARIEKLELAFVDHNREVDERMEKLEQYKTWTEDFIASLSSG